VRVTVAVSVVPQLAGAVVLEVVELNVALDDADVVTVVEIVELDVLLNDDDDDEDDDGGAHCWRRTDSRKSVRHLRRLRPRRCRWRRHD
jgi:hypothetical protein